VSEFYDRVGEPISLEVWARLMEDKDYTRVDRTKVGRAPLVVSTIWLGSDHRFLGEGPPIIYETMLFGPYNYGELGVWRTTTEDNARLAHGAAVLYATARYHGLVKHARDERRERMKHDLWALAHRDDDGIVGEMARAAHGLARFDRKPDW
jgi:hypothetical protein